MNLELSGKNALVFGSSAGIGKAIAAGLFNEGVNVCLASRSEEKLKAALEEIKRSSLTSKITYHVCDVSNYDDINNTVLHCQKEFGSIDILVNNQGGPIPGGFQNINEDQLRVSFDTNLLSFFRATKLCIDKMKEQKWGRIINILSVSAKEPIPNLFLSNVMRPAILGMSKTIAQEYAQYGVTMNSLLPSSVLTDRTRFFVEERANKEGRSYDEVLKEVASGLPSKYIPSPQEFAQLALFLCSRQASYVNGAAIPVDGASSKSLY